MNTRISLIARRSLTLMAALFALLSLVTTVRAENVWYDQTFKVYKRPIDQTFTVLSVNGGWSRPISMYGSYVDTGCNVYNGDHLQIWVNGQIWSGVWATGSNGPEGWDHPFQPWDAIAGSSFPLPTSYAELRSGNPYIYPSHSNVHPFGLIGMLSGLDRGSYSGNFWVGAWQDIAHVNLLSCNCSSGISRLYLRVNDFDTGRGNNYFTVRVRDTY